MTSGDEPQLGGQDHDNAPMISGRGTKIIADTRGAYVVGNLAGMLDGMDDAQVREAKVIIIRQVLESSRAHFETIPGFTETVPILERWLDDPSDANRQVIANYKRTEPPNLDGHRNTFSWLLSAVTLPGFTQLEDIVSIIMCNPGEWDRAYGSAVKCQVHDWFLELTWAIVRGAKVLPLPLERKSTEALIADAEYWYRKQHLELLVHQLSDAQWELFREAVYHQAMWYINLVPINHWPIKLIPFIETASTWFAHPPNISDEMYDEFYQKQGSSLAYAGFYNLVAPFRKHFPRYWGVAVREASMTQSLANYVVGLVEGRTFSTMSQKPSQIAKRWQIEAAWAILHDQRIPPLEGVPPMEGV